MGIIYKINFNEKIPAGDLYIKLEVDLTKDSPHALVFNKTNIEWGLYLTNDIEIKYNWDEDDFFIVIGEIELKLYDQLDNLSNSLNHINFLGLRIEIRVNNEIIYSGYTNEYSAELKQYTLIFKHDISRLNEIPVSINGTFNNQFPQDKYDFNSTNAYNLVELIKDFFGLVNSDIRTLVLNNWIFWSAYFNGQRYSCPLNDLKVQFRYIWIQETGGGLMFSFTNYMEALKSLLNSLGLWAGLIESDLAFVGSLLYPDVLQDGELLNFSLKKIRTPYSYVKITTGSYIWAELGERSSIEQKNKEINVRGSIFKVPVNNSDLTMSYIQRDINSPIVDYGNFIVNLFGQYYLSNYSYEARIKLNGINYKPFYGFLIGSQTFIFREITFNLTKNYTDIIAILVSD